MMREPVPRHHEVERLSRLTQRKNERRLGKTEKKQKRMRVLSLLHFIFFAFLRFEFSDGCFFLIFGSRSACCVRSYR